MGVDIENLKNIDREIVALYKQLRDELLVPSVQNIELLKRRIAHLRRIAIDVKNKVYGNSEVDLWVDHVLELLDSIDVSIENKVRNPSIFIRELGRKIYKTLLDKGKTVSEKFDSIKRTVEALPEFYGSLLRLLQKLGVNKIERTITTAEGFLKEVENFVKIVLDWQKEAAGHEKQLYFSVIEKLALIGFYTSKFIEDARNLKGDTNETLEDLPYDIYVEKMYGIPLKWVLSWYEEELQDSINNFEKLAKSIDPSRNPLEVLKESIHTPYSTPEEMFNDMKMFLEIARQEASKYLEIPHEVKCEVVSVKEFEKDVYPMGYADVPDPLEKDLTCRIALNQYNYRAFSRGWLMMMAIHEAFYGHNIHYIKVSLADTPTSFKIPSGIGCPLAEGLAHRGEELLKEIYGVKAFSLLVAWRRVQTALRVYIEIEMFYKGRILPEDAVKLYMEIMGFDEKTSKELVAYHLENRGYNLCYLTGYKMINEYKSRLKDMDEKTFSNMLFSAGFISIKNLKKLLGIKEKMPWE